MKSLLPGVALLLGCIASTGSARPNPRGPDQGAMPRPMIAQPGFGGRRAPDQDAAYEARRSGSIRSLREIERGVMPRMGGASYLGPEFDAGSSTYRLKFMRGGSVIWVDVDGRTGSIIGRSGE
jgi:hypothetical protein